MGRTPVPTPRRGDRARRAPVRYRFEDEDERSNAAEAINAAEAMSICSGASTASRASSRRAAELRLKHLQQEQELQRKHEESVRALEPLRAQNELERATLEEEEMAERRSILSVHGADTREETRPTVTEQCRDAQSIRVQDAASDKRPISVTITEAPKLDILPFDGDVAHYPLFKKQVSETVTSNDFSEAKIVRHLKDRLKGEAFNAVHGALLAGASLTRILHVLDTRFGNKLHVAQAVTSRLLERPTVSTTDPEDLARYSTEIYNTLAILETIGSDNELNNLRTINELVHKLPLDSQHAWGQYGRRRAEEDGEVTCRIFCDFLEEHAKDRQFGAVRIKQINQEASAKKPQPLPRKEKQSYATTTRNDAEAGPELVPEMRQRHEAGGRARISCYFCKQQHWISRCQAFQELTCDQRWKWTETSRSCVRCLSTSHQTQQCHRQLPCGIDGCKEKHHALLHAASRTTNVVGTIHQSQKIMLMKTVVMRIHGPVASKQCVAYPDEGSSLTLIEKDLAEEMGLSMKPDTMRIRTMTGVTEHDIGKLNLRVSSVATGGEFALRDVVAVDKLELSKNPVTVRDLADKYPHIEDKEIPHLDEAPRMLIGMDNAELIATRQLRKTTKNGPLLQKTLLGWTVTGQDLADVSVEDEQVRFVRRQEAGDSTLMDDTSRANWSTESFGCAYDRAVPEDRRAEAILQDEVDHNGTRWVAPILLRNTSVVFPPSRPMAEKRDHRLDYLRQDGVWASGPDFLHKSSDQCPEALDTSPGDSSRRPGNEDGVRRQRRSATSSDIRQSLPDLSRFSRWSTAVRTVCMILKWRNRARRHTLQKKSRCYRRQRASRTESRKPADEAGSAGFLRSGAA